MPRRKSLPQALCSGCRAPRPGRAPRSDATASARRAKSLCGRDRGTTCCPFLYLLRFYHAPPCHVIAAVSPSPSAWLRRLGRYLRHTARTRFQERVKPCLSDGGRGPAQRYASRLALCAAGAARWACVAPLRLAGPSGQQDLSCGRSHRRRLRLCRSQAPARTPTPRRLPARCVARRVASRRVGREASRPFALRWRWRADASPCAA